MSNLTQLASQIYTIYNGGVPNPQSRVTLSQVELLCKQVAAWVRVQDFSQMYDQFGVHQVDGKFVKDYTISLTTGGVGWKKAVLPVSYLALPTNRGIPYVYESGTLCVIEYWPKSELGQLAGGIAQTSGGYIYCPVGSYLEIRGTCNEKIPKIQDIDVGLVVPDESQVDEASDFILIEKVMLILRGQPWPDKTVNANPL